ncbi:hypothetical protein AMECASPLE_039322 [Ameca splendens]|uniref:Uncharacterized protein n=1 Tax=Ameca splendens TaxID=208324 RepID=A0ABV0ZTK4_9TELE
MTGTYHESVGIIVGCVMQVNTLPTADRKNMLLQLRNQARISAVFKSAEFGFDGSRAHSPTPGTYGEGTSTKNSPSVSCPAPDTQLKSSHHRIKAFDLAWLLEVK